ncbi:MAG: protein-L-isoaspartate O-methyltransferase family protein, partial [Burkholderiales bacterium]
MNLEQARFNMVESQIRPWEVLDQTVLDLLLTIKREEFVPEKYRALAFADMEIPLGHGEVMLAPKVEARMLQELGIRKTDKILEVGTGSGYV